MEIDWTKS